MKEELYNILHHHLGISENLLNGSHDDVALTGPVFRLNSVGMTYLFLEIEKEFKVIIDTAKILHYEFNTINGIVALLSQQET